MTDNVVDFTKRKLRKEPVIYSVEIHHTEGSLSFIIFDVKDSKEDRLKVARDLERIAKTIRHNETGAWTKDET